MAQIIGMQNVGQNTGEETQTGGQITGMEVLAEYLSNSRPEPQALAVATSESEIPAGEDSFSGTVGIPTEQLKRH